MSDFVLNNEQQKAFDTVMSGVNCFLTHHQASLVGSRSGFLHVRFGESL